MLKIGRNWGKIANYLPQCSTKIGTPDNSQLMGRKILCRRFDRLCFGHEYYAKPNVIRARMQSLKQAYG